MRRNIGIFAHVDAGKTTVSEWMLHLGGVTPAPGSVDAGTAQTDTMAVERQRGISVRAAAAAFSYGGVDITLVDTPGHADFAAEVERAIWALDGAVCVVSAAEGVQAQTEVYCAALQKAKVPMLFFINKTDRIGADVPRVLDELQGVLGATPVPLWDEERCLEAACEGDDGLLERYLAGEGIARDEIRKSLRGQTGRCACSPVLQGVALKGEGVDALLAAVVDFLPGPKGSAEDALCGIVYALSFDKTMGRAAHVRLFSGSLQNRQPIGEEKISQVRVLQGTKLVDKGALLAGEIGVVYGLADAKPGDVLGSRDFLPENRLSLEIARPLLSAKVTPDDPAMIRPLRAALMELTARDPHLGASWSPFTHELFVQLTGGIQTQILETVLQEEYGLACHFDKPTVLYKETIAKKATGFVAYTMPKPCWAILNFELTPLPRGSGVRYSCTVDPRKIPYRYRRQVEQTIPRALEQGMLGWEVTDIAIELFDGSDHPIHTHPLDFVLATPMGIMDGLQRGGSVLLEPILDLRFTVPAQIIGRLMSDLGTMRGSFDAPEQRGDMAILHARAPAAEMMDYPIALAALSGGRGVMVQRLLGYEPCPLELGKTAPRRGVSPLDTSKYILAARNALQSDIW